MADYAISNVPRRVVYAASGVGPYAFTFEILDQTDISVYKASTLLTLTTDYTVTINANGTGSVTLVTTAGTSNITIVGAKNIQRTSDFTTGGDLFANTLNDELDNQTIFIQQVAETAERGLKAPVTDPTDIAMTLPAKDGRKGKVLAFDSTTGNPVAGPALDSLVTVIEQSAYINAVGENIDDVIAVADNEANIDIVAGVSSNVTTVATNISNVNTVADDLNEPTSEIHVVGTNITNVNAVGNNISNVNTVAGVNAAVSTVAGISSAVSNVSSISGAVSGVNAISSAVTGVNSNSSNINTVAGQISPTNNVSTVAGISGSVSTVAGISSNVTSVAGNATNINTVAGISANVTTVAGIAANVTTVAGISANVTSVAGNASNINQVAADTTAINAASANAATATTKAAEALASANSASASAAAASAVALGNEPVRHSIRPSLLLDFANTKTLDPRITFTRGSTGTFYDGKTVAKAEENLFTYSQQFDDGAWGKASGSITTNTTTAPDGTTTAETFTENTANDVHYFGRSFTTLSSSDYAYSVYLKDIDRQYVSISFNRSSSSSVWASAVFDLVGGTVTGTNTNGGATLVSSSIVSVGSGWYRCQIVANIGANTDGQFVIGGASASSGAGFRGLQVYTGTSKAFYVWGAQQEQRSSVTAYTATGATAPITNYIPALQTAGNNVPRFEHNPVTGESLGLEIEEQRTNLATYASEADNAAWSKQRSSITANTIISPDGTLSGDKLVEDTTASNSHFVLQVVSGLSSSTNYTWSVHAKAGERTRVLLTDGAGSGASAYFDLLTGTVAASSSCTPAITSLGNGWYRCAITFTTGAAQTSVNGRIFLVQSGTNEFYTGNGFSGLFVWGAQLEAGSFATSYIPTVASQVTRSADSASMTGTNFSSWHRVDEGSWYYEASKTQSGNNYANLLIVRNSATAINERFPDVGFGMGAGGSAGIFRVDYRVNNVVVATIGDLSAFASNTFYKGGTAYKTNDFISASNAVVSSPDSTGEVSNIVNILEIGGRNGGNYLCGNIKKLAYYPKRLTNAELQGLTTV